MQQHRVDAEEIGGEDAAELSPARPAAARCGVDAGGNVSGGQGVAGSNPVVPTAKAQVRGRILLKGIRPLDRLTVV
jgi:hypothetical protein